MIKRILKFIFLLLLVLSLFYFIGPKPVSSDLSRSIQPIGTDLNGLDAYISKKEASVPNIKEDNQARVVWADPTLKAKTEYAVVYLHGFSASQGEGFPMHIDFAKRYGFNLYLARLDGHGTSEFDAMAGLTSEDLVNSSKEAIAIGSVLGKKVIVMGTSNGCTLALYLASGQSDIHSLIMYSPNVAVENSAVKYVTGPWGKQMAKFAAKGDVVSWGKKTGNDSLYWNASYSIDGLIAMQDLIDQTMNLSTFESVNQPSFMGYYYKNDQEKDHTVSVSAMLRMFDQLGTKEAEKVKIAFPEAGRHVIASSYKSTDLEGVRQATYRFAENILHLQPINKE